VRKKRHNLETTDVHKLKLKKKGQELLTFLEDFDKIVELEIFADRENTKYCIWVNVYAPWSVLRYLGYVLMECKVYLQNPSWNTQNVPYYNSQRYEMKNDVGVILYTQHLLIFDTSVSEGSIERTVEFTRRDERQLLKNFFVFEEDLLQESSPNIKSVRAIWDLGKPLKMSPTRLFYVTAEFFESENEKKVESGDADDSRKQKTYTDKKPGGKNKKRRH
jgi:hypothetical protein